MSPVRPPALPMPTKAEVLELVSFLAANVAVSQEDGHPEKADRYQALLDTVKALAERAVDLVDVSRVVIVTQGAGRLYDRGALYSNGCVAEVQDDGRTLKLIPTPRPGSFI
ncbi:hypothetical protein [Cryobacterium zhongshanensis]|uniref:Uncharacterized protein n=1 Tax=Cryobacterium zhongshanensis TaxID=2928153 RepID=A0AA41UIP5_9MICO|nr:hypothetical protein [Cryobacterium zhongshanensis]MCI4659769.1 hypothetical protein [Cryobacterium zhongshanensis]